MSGYIIHFDNETELVHYGVKGMKWEHKKGKTQYSNNSWDTPAWRKKQVKILRKAAKGMNRESDLANQKRLAKKSAKNPLDPRKAKRFEKYALNKRSKVVENKIYKDLKSDKKMSKKYKIGTANVYIDKDSSGTVTSAIGKKTSHDRAANKALNKAWNRNLSDIRKKENNRFLKKADRFVKKWFKKIF